MHGADQIQSGGRQALSGREIDSLTSQGMQATGLVNRNQANMIDAGASIAFSLGGGLAANSMRGGGAVASEFGSIGSTGVVGENALRTLGVNLKCFSELRKVVDMLIS